MPVPAPCCMLHKQISTYVNENSLQASFRSAVTSPESPSSPTHKRAMDASYRRPVVTGARPGGYSTPGGSKSGSSSSKQPLRPTLSYQHHLDPAQALKQKQKHQLQSLRKKWTSYFSESESYRANTTHYFFPSWSFFF